MRLAAQTGYRSAALRAALLPRVRLAIVIRLGARCADLVAFADGELDAPRAASFRDHLRLCEACRAKLPGAVALGAQLGDLGDLGGAR